MFTYKDLIRTRNQCPGCGSNSFKILFGPVKFHDPIIESFLKTTWSGRVDWEYLNKYLKEYDYCLLQCKDCTLIWQKHVPDSQLLDVLYEDLSVYTAELSEEIFDKLYTVINRKLTGERKIFENPDKSSAFWQEVTTFYCNNNKQFPKHTKDLIDLTQQMFIIGEYFRTNKICVADFGMGAGEWCRLASAHGFNTFGLEYSEEKAKWRLDGGYRVITHKDLPNHRFDFINAEQVFEHLNEPLKTLKKLTKSLSEKGLIRINVPHGYGIEKKLSKKKAWSSSKGSKLSLHAVRPLRHVNCFTGQSLTSMANHAGLRRVDISIMHKLKSSVGLRAVLKAPAIWAYRRLRPNYFSLQYYTRETAVEAKK